MLETLLPYVGGLLVLGGGSYAVKDYLPKSKSSPDYMSRMQDLMSSIPADLEENELTLTKGDLTITLKVERKKK